MDEWVNLKVPALRDKCTELGLPSTGLRRDLLTRLETHEKERKARPASQYRTEHQQMYDPRKSTSILNHQYQQIPTGPRADGLGQPRVPLSVLHNDSSRRDSGNALQQQQDYSVKSEYELELLCRENWQPFAEDHMGHERRAKIRAENELKYNEAKTKKDAAIQRAIKKFNTEAEKLKSEKEESLKVLEETVSQRMVKGRVWGPAFGELRVC